MNTKMVVPGICVAGAVVAVAAFLKNTTDSTAIKGQYQKEIETYNSLPPTEHGKSDDALIRAQQLRDSLDPEKAKLRDAERLAAVQAKTDSERVAHYKKAIGIDPKDDDSMLLLAGRLEAMGKIEEAKEFYGKIIKNSDRKIKIRIAMAKLDKLK